MSGFGLQASAPRCRVAAQEQRWEEPQQAGIVQR
jgi:hypothetical protein